MGSAVILKGETASSSPEQANGIGTEPQLEEYKRVFALESSTRTSR